MSTVYNIIDYSLRITRLVFVQGEAA
jgi:hypothetical protein